MLNHIVIMGRLAWDPELRHTPNGVPVASFRLAVDRDFKDKQTGERATDWIDVVAWRSTGEFVSRYFSKGRMAVVEGRLQIREWTDKDGNRRTSAEVVADNVYFGDSRRDGENNSYGGNNNYGGGSQGGYNAPSYGGGQGSAQGGYSAPASGGYSAPGNSDFSAPGGFDAPSGADQYAALTDDDGELPF